MGWPDPSSAHSLAVRSRWRSDGGGCQHKIAEGKSTIRNLFIFMVHRVSHPLLPPLSKPVPSKRSLASHKITLSEAAAETGRGGDQQAAKARRRTRPSVK